MFRKLLITSVFLLLGSFLVRPIFAQEQESVELYWGTTCPYCRVVKEEIEKKGFKDVIDIKELEIYEDQQNLLIFQGRIAKCGVNPNQAGVPMLYADGKCLFGVDDIVGQLERMAGGESEVLAEDVVVDEGKRNTGFVIGGGFLALVLLVVVGSSMQKKKVLSFGLSFLILPFLAKPVLAMCPVCTVAVGAGLGLSQYFGIDDVITAVWIGGLMISTSMWTVNWLEKKNIKSLWSKVLTYVLMYGFLALSLYWIDAVGHPLNTLWGIDKIVLGTVLGSLMFIAFAQLHLYLKKKNNDKVYFPFQKVVFTVGSLLLLTLVFYIILY